MAGPWGGPSRKIDDPLRTSSRPILVVVVMAVVVGSWEDGGVIQQSEWMSRTEGSNNKTKHKAR